MCSLIHFAMGFGLNSMTACDKHIGDLPDEDSTGGTHEVTCEDCLDALINLGTLAECRMSIIRGD